MHELLGLIRVLQVTAFLYHKTWETRVAAGEAIGLLADHFVHPSVKDLGEKCHASPPKSHYISLTFKNFNLQHVLEKGSALLACGGQVKAFTVYRFSV
jgi:hypothetical protein